MRVLRGLHHLGVIAAALIRRNRRKQLLALMHVLVESRQRLLSGGLPALIRFLDDRVWSQPAAGDTQTLLAQADAVAALCALPRLRYCMRRTALQYYILRSERQAASFVIGIRRVGQATLDGHAWIELDGSAFREEDEQHRAMTVIYQHPSTAAPSAAEAASRAPDSR